jgi:hypothetical protein
MVLESGVDAVRGADVADALQFALGDLQRQIGARQAQRRADADPARDQPRHAKVKRIARPFAIGEQPVEFRVGAGRRRREPTAAAAQQRGEDLPAKFEIVDRRQLDRLGRIEQRGHGARSVVAAGAEDRRQPADRAARLPLDQQQAKARPTALERRVGEFARPSANLFGAAGGIIDDDEDRFVPAPLRDIVLRAETVEFMRLDEAGEPSFPGNPARELHREARLAASARADQRAHRRRRFAFEPTPEIGDRAFATEQRRDILAIGAQQRRFRIAVRREPSAIVVLRQTQIGPPGLNRHVHAAAVRLHDDVVVAEDGRVLGGRSIGRPGMAREASRSR